MSSLRAQPIPKPPPRVGLIFFQFSDFGTNADAKGSVGYGRGIGDEFKYSRPKIDPKYSVRDYYDLFFKEQGWLAHPDSFSHGPRYTGLYAMGMKGSLRTWVRENSFGREDVVPYQYKDRVPGILNKVISAPGDTSLMDAHIEWITVTAPKRFFFSNPDPIRPFYELQAASESILDDSLREDGRRWWRDNLDIVFVIVAGANIPHMQTFAGLDSSWLTPRRPIMVFLPEKSANPGAPYNVTETILQYKLTSIAHEFIHACGFYHGVEIWDINQPHYKESHYIGEFGSYYERQQTPPHLDPWRKLQLGWLDWQMVAGNVKNLVMPIVERPEQGKPPRVAVIPLSVPRAWTDEPDWKKGHYLIIENRRADGFDEFTLADQNRYDPRPQLPGGFLVWEYVDSLLVNEDDGVDGLTLIEADGGHHLDLGGKLPRGIDFFMSPQTVTMWTSPDLLGVESASLRDSNDVFARKSGPELAIRFGEYTATRELTNTIPLIEFGAPTTNNPRALEGNGGPKVASSGDRACMVETVTMNDTTDGLVFAHVSTNAGETWTTRHLLNRMRLKQGSNIDKTPQYPAGAPSVILFDAADGGDGAFHAVWRENVNGAFMVRTAIPSGEAVDITAAPVFAPLGGAITPVMDFKNGVARVVFASVDGLMESFSADRGRTWSTPARIAGTSAYSVNPSLAANAAHEALVYQDNAGSAQLRAMIDGAPAVDITSGLAGTRDHATPCVALQGDTVHLAWIAGVREIVGGVPVVRMRACHAMWPAAAPPASMVVTTLDAGGVTSEQSMHPVVAARPGGGVGVMWGVVKTGGSAMLRFNRYADGGWYASDRGTALRDSVSRSAALFASSNDLRYCAVFGAMAPLRFVVRDFGAPADSLRGAPRTETLAATGRVDDAAADPRSGRDTWDRSAMPVGAPRYNAAVMSSNAGEPDWTVRAWPQPARDMVQVAVATRRFDGDAEISLYNSLGVRLKSVHVADAAGDVRTLRIELSDVPSGVYMLTVHGGGKVVSTRMAVTR